MSVSLSLTNANLLMVSITLVLFVYYIMSINKKNHRNSLIESLYLGKRYTKQATMVKCQLINIVSDGDIMLAECSSNDAQIKDKFSKYNKPYDSSKRAFTRFYAALPNDSVAFVNKAKYGDEITVAFYELAHENGQTALTAYVMEYPTIKYLENMSDIVQNTATIVSIDEEKELTSKTKVLRLAGRVCTYLGLIALLFGFNISIAAILINISFVLSMLNREFTPYTKVEKLCIIAYSNQLNSEKKDIIKTPMPACVAMDGPKPETAKEKEEWSPIKKALRELEKELDVFISEKVLPLDPVKEDLLSNEDNISDESDEVIVEKPLSCSVCGCCFEDEADFSFCPHCGAPQTRLIETIKEDVAEIIDNKYNKGSIPNAPVTDSKSENSNTVLQEEHVQVKKEPKRNQSGSKRASELDDIITSIT